MKLVGIGFGTFVLGFILCSLLASIFMAGSPTIGSSYLGFIGFSMLYLASILSVCTFLILKKLNKFCGANGC
ncbi:hypothetical protein [Pontibacillus salipaludis]|uniref:Uncharacterized protein n=1 Tax=Pontibacillus salipaludis TaxID=1697394 RepID=A0ABQ1Q4J3_9BACI|nr:hypothetical protein [Pontibacillus salipaludis]GGD13582.1 hypothetical protein GCM10011389_21520 [Pontibacillus salipaludis]